MNAQAINDAKAKHNWTLWLILSCLILALLFSIFIFLFIKRRKRQKENDAELLAQKKMLEHLLATSDEH